MKKTIYKLIEKGAHGSKVNLVFDISIMVLILLNVTALILESIPEIKYQLAGPLRVFEIISVIIFSIEYLLRIYASSITHPARNNFKSGLKFVFSIYGIIDLLAIMPFYMPFMIAIDLRFLRVIRLIRITRLLKINRYNNSLSLIWEVIKDKKKELAITGFTVFLFLIVSSFLMYYIEGPVQEKSFTNLLDSMWWAVATLTTIGYGDIVPITALGKTISGLLAIAGVGIVALPTGLISAGFIEKIGKKEKKKCPYCKKDLE